MPFAVYIFEVVLLQLDPYSFMYNHLLTDDSFNIKLMILLLRLISFFATSQVCRSLAFIICLPTILMQLILSCIEHLDKNVWKLIIFRRNSTSKYFLNYNSLQIAISSAMDYIASFVALLMLSGFAGSVIFIYISLKMHHVIPMPLYLYFPTVAVLILIIIMVQTPMVINIYENGVLLQHKWKRGLCRSHDKPYIIRQVKSIKIVRFYAGCPRYNVYYCCQSTMFAYLDEIIDKVIAALLSI